MAATLHSRRELPYIGIPAAFDIDTARGLTAHHFCSELTSSLLLTTIGGSATAATLHSWP